MKDVYIEIYGEDKNYKIKKIIKLKLKKLSKKQNRK